MPIKITKKSKRTKKGKGKISQSQQVIVNIQKGKRKASSQPVSRPSQAPIIIQQPQQDFTQLENLFKQYSTSRPVVEPKPVTIGMETQTETPIMVDKETLVKLIKPDKLEQELILEQQRLREKLAEIEKEKEKSLFVRQRQPAPQRPRPVSSLLEVRSIPNKVINPDTNRMIKVGGTAYNKLVNEGKIIPE